MQNIISPASNSLKAGRFFMVFHETWSKFAISEDSE